MASMPHMLIAGTTGAGKSVCINAIIATLLLHNTPENLKLMLIDPKRVELTAYNSVPHLMAPVVVDLDRIVPSLQWITREMDNRYDKFAMIGARNITDFNKRAVSADLHAFPNLVVVVDELADLMMIAPDETERIVTRLAQLARATGIHLVIATQRPSVDVLTGLIKANFPARISFAVASAVDSRVIIDQSGAERLLGRGDMLFLPPDSPQSMRMQGAFISGAEISRLVAFWKKAGADQVLSKSTSASSDDVTSSSSSQDASHSASWEEIEQAAKEEQRDQMYDEAVRVVRELRKASISLLQRRLRIGYTRAAKLIDVLEEAGVIGPAKSGAKQRDVLDYGQSREEPGLPAEDQ
jgi:S-DNA-T family DNA segregation ATPase FtsK/SpoIIIE